MVDGRRGRANRSGVAASCLLGLSRLRVARWESRRTACCNLDMARLVTRGFQIRNRCSAYWLDVRLILSLLRQPCTGRLGRDVGSGLGDDALACACSRTRCIDSIERAAAHATGRSRRIRSGARDDGVLLPLFERTLLVSTRDDGRGDWRRRWHRPSLLYRRRSEGKPAPTRAGPASTLRQTKHCTSCYASAPELVNMTSTGLASAEPMARQT